MLPVQVQLNDLRVLIIYEKVELKTPGNWPSNSRTKYSNMYDADIVIRIEDDKIFVIKNRLGFQNYHFAINDSKVST